MDHPRIFFENSGDDRKGGSGDDRGRKMEKRFYVYIMTNKRNGTLYIGVTSDLPKRTWEHKNGAAEGFTKKYDIKTLVYYEVYDAPENAIHREKRLKKYKREAKINLIERGNPEWSDLYESVCK